MMSEFERTNVDALLKRAHELIEGSKQVRHKLERMMDEIEQRVVLYREDEPKAPVPKGRKSLP